MQLPEKQPIMYVTRDIERALGLNLEASGCFIISNFSAFANQIRAGKENVFLIKEEKLLDTHELLTHPKARAYISKQKNPRIIVFKNTKHIERICKEHGWTLLNPPADLANRVEEKISQVEWLGELQRYLPASSVLACKNAAWGGTPFILQFNRAHTGGGTHLIESKKELEKLQEVFPDRPVRVSVYIEGPMFTNNNVVMSSDILVGNISYQITGLPPFTDKPFATIGNDWGIAKTLLNEEQKRAYKEIVLAVGEKLKHDGWKGLFGVDIILEEKTGKLFLIEINARQPASVVFESELQKSNTVFEAHLASLLADVVSERTLTRIEDGAQIILRNQELGIANRISQIKQTLKNKGFKVTEYDNTKPGSDLLRIQSTQSIMQGHNMFNAIGRNIAECVAANTGSSQEEILSDEARRRIDRYLHLHINGNTIPCPYFNNKRNRVRAGLRVLVGKGSPEEIEEEAALIAMREKVDLTALSNDDLKTFFVEHNLGIDCAGLAYYILDAESKARGKGPLKKRLSFPFAKNPIRKLLSKLRPAENTNVRVLSHESNSAPALLDATKPGDMIVILDTKNGKHWDHILVIHRVLREDGALKRIDYTHSLQWDTDGPYRHGVRQGIIEIINPKENILRQRWTEQEKTGEENKTFVRAKRAQKVDVRRLIEK